MSSAFDAIPLPVKKIAALVLGLGALGLFAFWPMYQVTQGAEKVSISFKGIVLGAMITAAALNTLLLGNAGIPWKKVPGQTLTPIQRTGIYATVLAALLMVGLVWWFFSMHGYSMKF